MQTRKNFTFGSQFSFMTSSLTNASGANNLQPFLPNQLTGLVLWLDASDPFANGSLPPNNSSVAQWIDKSKNGNDAIQATTAAKPTFLTNQQNGLPGISFSGTNYMLTGFSGFPTGSTGRSLFIVVKTGTAAPSVSQGFIFFAGTYSANQSLKSFGVDIDNIAGIGGLGWAVNIYATGVQQTTNRPTNNTPFVYDVSYLAGQNIDQVSSYVNGNLQTNSASANVPNTVYEQSILGEFYNGGGAGYHGQILEILYYNTQLSAANQTLVRKYLGAKWGISV